MQYLKCGKYKLEISKKTHVMGILNLSQDSFFKGSSYPDVESAIERANEMVEQGADIIDIGGESTRPGSEPLTVAEEIKRVIPVIEKLLDEIKVPISLDTYKVKVAEKALEIGVHMINDIYGLRAEGMAKLIAKYDVPVVIMHMQGNPKDMQKNPNYKDVTKEIINFLKERAKFAVNSGINSNKIIIDPGIGFGKTTEHNLEIIRNLAEFKSLGYPILIGPSRKSFIGNILNLGPEERLEGTLAAISISIMNGANIVRVHDVTEAVRTSRIVDAIMRGKYD